PLYWYEKIGDTENREGSDQFALPGGKLDADGYARHDAITDWSLSEFRNHYQDKSISKEDVFYYVYGLLHSPQYREKYESSLKKMLPRIPFAADFHGFSKAGRSLAKLHLGYETVEPWPVAEESMDLALVPKDLYHVEKMVYAKNSKEVDRTKIILNSRVRLIGIPLEAYEYVVNGKSAIDWVMERYAISVEKNSGIRNDPNTWSDDPRYIIDLVKRVVRVSVETVRIVKNLPAL
ncbi:MAG: type ISP restriction/modification enzyme, partial [Dehalococcoidia bacterium]|nr:type ISP restriction/modification enzyme [Dehalococcoidia bacterium]